MAAWRADNAVRSDGEHVDVRLIDFDDPENNKFVVASRSPSGRAASRCASTSCCS